MKRDPREPFIAANSSLPFTITNFWQWNQSQLLENNLRGVLAEFIVMNALGIENDGRKEWVAYDLETPEGLRIEVKSSAYLQNWEQNAPSKISFGISEASAWDWEIDKRSSERKRHSDCYVFCLFTETDRSKANPLNMDQWEFYLLPTRVLDEKCPGQKNIGFNGLQKLGAVKSGYGELKAVFDQLTSPSI
jgi:hypothetical protein